MRDILGALFFISLGMLVDVSTAVRHSPIIVGVTALIIAVKSAAGCGALLLSAAPFRVAATAGIGLAQVGEFSFILGRSGLEAGLMP